MYCIQICKDSACIYRTKQGQRMTGMAIAATFVNDVCVRLRVRSDQARLRPRTCAWRFPFIVASSNSVRSGGGGCNQPSGIGLGAWGRPASHHPKRF